MFRPQCLVFLLFSFIAYVKTWDIAITAGDQLEFYTNKTRIAAEGDRFRDLTALAYDAVHNMLLFVDRHNDNASIFSYDLDGKKYKRLVGRRSNEDIKDLVFDPVQNVLFWIDTNKKSIYWMSLKPDSAKESREKIYGNVLFNLPDEIPRGIAVDSCRGYVYWTNMYNGNATIERYKFDDLNSNHVANKSKIEVIVNLNIDGPVSIAVDQHEKKLYWADKRAGIHYSIESSDLDGKNMNTLLRDIHHEPNALTVSKDSIYWVDLAFKKVWKLPKDTDGYMSPEEFISFSNKMPFGIVSNYTVAQQTEGVTDCSALVAVSLNKTEIKDSFQEDLGLYCIHGVKVEGEMPSCKCSAGYIGQRCDISVCHNYCVQGECSLRSDGQPKCSCIPGHNGERCEVNQCNNYCLNDGVCSLGTQKPLCKCKKGFEGQRCETKVVPKIIAPVIVPELINECNCTRINNTETTQVVADSEVMTGEYSSMMEQCSGWESVRNRIIMVLGTLIALLCVLCTVLVAKILKLQKRPRIKKRIIVNKNVTPLTARPDQCEITIENCCNMNICETPCFEPRTTIRPNLLDTKPGKEEKKNLISNMELPDDY